MPFGKRKDGKQKMNPHKTGKLNKSQAIGDARRLIIAGRDRETVIEFLMENYGYSQSSAQSIYYMGYNLTEEAIEINKVKIAERNIRKLHTLVDEAIAQGKYQDANKALDIINKMNGLYIEKIEVNSNEPIKIDFGK